MVLMYYKLGISAVIGGLVIILSAPAQYFLGRAMSKIQKKVMVNFYRQFSTLILKK